MFLPDTDITEALQSEIDRLAAQGGGEVLVPSGAYQLRAIQLRSYVCLHLQAGARLRFSGRKEDYPPVGYEHNEMGEVHAAIFAMGARCVTIKGEGEIDLNGTSFYDPSDPDTLDSLGPQVTPEHLSEAPRRYSWRLNQPLFFHECTDVRIEGIRIVDSPCWTITFNLCRNVTARGLTIANSLVIPNSDGVHCCGCRDVIITGCHVVAGDDCVALSSITDWDRACENVIISDCIFQSASKALSVGYMHSIVRNVLINNVVVKRSNRAYVTMCHPRTGLVENVRVSNCYLEGRSYAGNWWGNGEPIVVMVTPHHLAQNRDPQPADRFEPCVRNITFSSVVCRGERPVGMVAEGPGLTENLQLVNCTVEIVPEERPSLKGNTIDLAPGPQNLEIPDARARVINRHADLRLCNVTNERGEAIEARTV
ncbi:MAG: glycoside hydrolase family 28 protein [Opitutales bacterium]